MTDVKICVQCRFSSDYTSPYSIRCVHPNNELGVDLVTGSMIYKYNNCRDQRETFSKAKNNTICGKEGNWFEPK